MAEDDEYRLEVLMAVPNVTRLDKDEFVDDDRLEAADLAKQREAQKVGTRHGWSGRVGSGGVGSDRRHGRPTGSLI